MHRFIRETVRQRFGSTIAEDVSILYGGSVKPENAKEIFSKPDVDGGLIGGAALKATDFAAIVSSI
jgi:triosephosphate isomerase